MASSFSCLLFVVLCLLLLPLLASGAVYNIFVDANNPGAGSGTSADPYKNIDSAFAFIAPLMSDIFTPSATFILNVASGTYSVSTGLNTNTINPRNLQIYGTGSTPPNFVCTGSVSFINVDVTIGELFWFTVRNMNVYNCGGSIRLTNAKNVTVDKVRVEGDKGTFGGPLDLRVGCLSCGGIMRIANCAFVGNTIQGVNSTAVLNFDLTAGTDILVDNTVVTDNVGSGHVVFSMAPKIVISNSLFRNNRGFSQVFYLTQYTAVSNIDASIMDTVIRGNSVTADVIAISDSSGGSASVRLTISGLTSIVQNTISTSVVRTLNSFEEIYFGLQTILSQNSRDIIICAGPATVYDPKNNSLCNVVCPIGTSFDPCFVCGGASTCVGCDGVAYSGAICSNPATSIVGNTTTVSDPVVLWNATVPDPLILPFAGANESLNVQFGMLQEIDTNGNISQSLDLSTLPWVITVPSANQPDADGNNYVRIYRYYATNGSSLFLEIKQTLFRQSTPIVSGGVSFIVDEDVLKIDLQIDQWPFQASGNYLVFDINVTTSENEQKTNYDIIPLSNFTTTSVRVQTPNTQVKYNLQKWAVFDNFTLPIEINRLSTTPNSAVFQFVLPYQFSHMDYDPDFGIVISTQTDEGNGTDTDLIVGLTVGLGGFALLAVIVVVVVGTAVGTYLKMRKRKKLTTFVANNL